jgi:phosphinothricin acetyltransferase
MLTLRPAVIGDLPAITGIYNDAVLHTTATFDTEVKTADGMMAWWSRHDDKYAVWVAEENGVLTGWASLSRWSDRAAYDDTVELSVYIHPGHRGKGLGRGLMEAVLADGKKHGVHAVLSRITQDNAVSIHLHEALGFFHVGLMREVGTKFGRLLDVHMMQRLL